MYEYIDTQSTQSKPAYLNLFLKLPCSILQFCPNFQAGVGVELVRILPETHAPILTNIFAECDSRDDIVSNRAVISPFGRQY